MRQRCVFVCLRLVTLAHMHAEKTAIRLWLSTTGESIESLPEHDLSFSWLHLCLCSHSLSLSSSSTPSSCLTLPATLIPSLVLLVFSPALALCLSFSVYLSTAVDVIVSRSGSSPVHVCVLPLLLLSSGSTQLEWTNHSCLCARVCVCAHVCEYMRFCLLCAR